MIREQSLFYADNFDEAHTGILEGCCWYVGQLREVPRVISQGATLKELEDNIQDAYQLMIKEHRPASRRRAKTELIAFTT